MDTIEDLKVRLATARAEGLEMKNGVARGELVSRQEVEFAVGDRIARARMLMLSWPGRLGVEIAAAIGAEPDRIIAILRAAVRETLNEIAAAEVAEADRLAAAEAEVTPTKGALLPPDLEAPPAAVGRKRRHRATGRPKGRPLGSVGVKLT